ncbi:TonB-dependent receptor [Danxiaibacter flavus]|uniref:TonB-dependent receptor n=1 Tax=Danxiaibacter flavus TaxID=3049108 RepID=A0ABV3ZC55_9BACT|nr:TonB-dependent receptor [Chitinophagaceae bacterium DXS]
MANKLACFLILLTLSCSLFVLQAKAQTGKVTGKVLSENGSAPLQGANVNVKGKLTTVETGPDGSFTIQASDDDILVISYVGYVKKETPVAGKTSFSISLSQQDAKLDEVVVVGYGTQSRRNVTSSIAKLDNAVLQNAPRANVGGALQGTVPGLQVVNASGAPGAAPLILLRGGASINSPGAPLVVVDGVIRPFNDIAAEDIASIEVLKDAASTAIYGARASNGVILITTKQGKAGAAQISYKFTGGYNKRRDGYEYMNAKDYIYYNRLGNLNAGRTLNAVNGSRGYGLLTDAANLASFDIRAYTPDNSNLLSMGWDTVGDPYGGTIIFKDHGKEIENLVFRNTYTQDHYVNVTGGNDRGRYFASFDYYNEDGVIVGSSYKRYSGDLSGSYKIKPNVEVATGVTLSTSSQIGALASDANTLYRSMALWPTFNPWLDSAKTKPNPGNSISDGNPLYWLGKYKRSNEVNRIAANASVKWDILPGLFFKASGNIYLQETVNQSFTQFTQTYSQLFGNPPSGDTTRTATAAFSRNFQQTYNGILNYTKNFGKHGFNVMVGAESYNIKSLGMQVQGTKAATDNISTVNASTLFAAGNNTSSSSEFAILSTFGRLNYDYAQKYLLTVVFRRDGVSSLAAANRYGVFPGMSAGWNMHKEKFYTKAGLDRIVNTFKPRISYGENGNVNQNSIGPYDVQGVYSSQGNYNGSAGFLNTGIINSSLEWEKSKTTDIGVDFSVLNNRVTVMFDYFDRRSYNLLTNLALPSYAGFSSVLTNYGTFQNKGYEFNVNANILNLSNGFTWNMSANGSFVKNKILQLPANGQPNNRQGGFDVWDEHTKQLKHVGGLQEGSAIGDIYAYKQVGIFKDDKEIAAVAGNRYDAVAKITGPNLAAGSGGRITPGDVNWLDVKGNDTIDSRDQVYIGNIYPKWTGGFTTTFGYKGFTLYSRFEFALGHTIYNDLVARTLGNYQGTFNYITLQKSAWSPQHTETDIPKVYYADQVVGSKQNYTRGNNANAVLNGNNSRFYEKGDYLACREITLSYDFARQLLAHTKVLSQARVYVSANNLFYVTKFSGPSPEPPVAQGTSSITGVYVGSYPTPKTFVLGVQVSF